MIQLIAALAFIHFGVFGNNVLGDCSVVAEANVVQFVTGERGTEAPISRDRVEAVWDGLGGSGVNVLDAFAAWKDEPLGGYELTGYTPITGRAELERALLGGLGVETIWQQGPSLHAMAVVGADRWGVTIIYYGQVFTASWDSWDKNVVETFALTLDKVAQ